MAASRYSRDRAIKGSTVRATASATRAIREAIDAGRLDFVERDLQGRERLDTIAGVVYGEARYWWILAAASNIGWGLQVPPGTRIVVPSLPQVLSPIVTGKQSLVFLRRSLLGSP